MLFYFPGQITCLDLDHVLSTTWKMLAAHGVDEVSDLQISMVGWREGSQCYVADANGALSHVVFDRLIEDDGTPVNAWVPRPGFGIYNLQRPFLQPCPRTPARAGRGKSHAAG